MQKRFISKIRNIGIIAHIDAGKTSVTERMLFKAGVTRRVGDVDDGNTIMDYMQQERDRGITIQSAAITFPWRGKTQINLIDTPGHADFTYEVERSIRVLDGAVCLVDAVSGVQAQTRVVWSQAQKYKLPRLLFINKMDKEGADFARCLVDVSSSLSCVVLPLCVPLFRDQVFVGSFNVLDQTVNAFNDKSESLLTIDQAVKLGLLSFDVIERTNAVKQHTVDVLSDIDDAFLEYVLELGSAQPSIQQIKAAIRRATIKGMVVPALCGSAYKGISVTTLLDAVTDFLPSPEEGQPIMAILSSEKRPVQLQLNKDAELCALAFKVVNDKNKGPLVFCRVYSGLLKTQSIVLNSSQNIQERIQKLYQVKADEYIEVATIEAGNIGLVGGLLDVKTGDTLVAVPKQKSKLQLVLPNIHTPPTVFSASIEPESNSQERGLFQALNQLQKEDPSFNIGVDSDTNQIVINGMGELHIEIIAGRLRDDYGVKFRLGKIWISYRETLKRSFQKAISDFTVDEVDRHGKRQFAQLSALIRRHQDDDEVRVSDKNYVSIRNDGIQVLSDGHSPKTSPHTKAEIQKAVNDGFSMALTRGELVGFPCCYIGVECTSIKLEHSTSLATLKTCAAKLLQKGLKSDVKPQSGASADIYKSSNMSLMEPQVKIYLKVPEQYFGTVLADLTSLRKAEIEQMGDQTDHRTDSIIAHQLLARALKGLVEVFNIDQPSENLGKFKSREVVATVPLCQMLGYSAALRSLSQGHASFQMELLGYTDVGVTQAVELLKQFRGI